MNTIICPYCQHSIIQKEFQNHGETRLLLCKKCQKEFEIMLHNKSFFIYKKLQNPKIEYVL